MKSPIWIHKEIKTAPSTSTPEYWVQNQNSLLNSTKVNIYTQQSSAPL
uniref:Uncharacterized protein n=1 Tax=Vibrio splendidus TaxID=29497 RepID=A0A0H3ZJG9_VIBSP|nr:hypothetical protein [Vibrio splendidus]